MYERKPQTGDIGLAKIGGLLGWIIAMGQTAIGDGSIWTHAYVMVDDHCLIAAQPSGARYDSIKNYTNKSVILDIPLTQKQREDIARYASSLEGVKYGFSGYLYIVLASFGIRPAWLLKYVKHNGRFICSSLADYVYNMAGIKLFDDGRIFQDVSPSDLANLNYAKFNVR